jgi:hypothetical protein
MCRAVRCRVCAKTTWSGCGMHVDEVKRDVPADQWCGGHASSELAPSRRESSRKKRYRW